MTTGIKPEELEKCPEITYLLRILTGLQNKMFENTYRINRRERYLDTNSCYFTIFLISI